MEKMDYTVLYQQLVRRYAENKATEEELEVFFHLLKEGKLEKILAESMNQAAGINEYEDVSVYPMYPPNPIIPNVRARFWKRIAVAASIILVIGVSSYFFFFNKPSGSTIAKTTDSQDVKAPSSNRATITLASGQIVYLDSAGNGTLATEGNMQLVKLADGQIVYKGSGSSSPGEGVGYHTLTNPRGSKVIDMQLSDGSHVWLNAGSSVTYPIAFIGNERKVEITGEAYFEISASPRPSSRSKSGTSSGGEGVVKTPFIVKHGDVEVTVLGTHFNVNAYDDEDEIKVTLLEGSVKVENRSTKIENRSSLMLKPGQQAVFTSHSPLATRHSPDLAEVMAWKNGKFVFGDKADIGTIMRQIARWYDVDVVYDGAVPNQRFGGEMPRNSNLSQVLEILKTSGVKFTIDGRKVTIRP